MPMQPPLLYLPLLHTDMGKFCSQDFPKAQAFWPGLPNPAENTWAPEAYPFSPKEAEVCLKDIQSMGETALSGVPLQAFINQKPLRSELQDINEQEALEDFIATGKTPTAKATVSLHELRAAQKFLLWTWLLEEHLLEVQRLTENYALGAANLTSALGVEKDDALAGLELIQNMLSASDFALPPWRLVMENMAYFLPKHSLAIINNKDMAEHIMENFSTSPLDDATRTKLSILTAAQFCQCTLSLGQLLDKKTSESTSMCFEKTVQCILFKEYTCQ